MASACVMSPTKIHSPDLESPPCDFEFRLGLTTDFMLPADQLFSDGKLLPLHTPAVSTTTHSALHAVTSPDHEKTRSSRWRGILGLKNKKPAKTTTTTSSSGKSTSIKQLLQRKNAKAESSSSSSSSLSLPLLNKSVDSSSSSLLSLDCLSESTFSISSSRLSLSSSSSSGHEHDDLARLSLDEKPRERVRLVRPRMVLGERPSLKSHATTTTTSVGRNGRRDPPQTRGLSVDSPRMNAAGRIVFQSLERSSSSPSSLNGGPRYKYRGMERSYSANVRITPVLNVPVCSLRGSSKSGGFGFGHLFTSSSSSSSSQRKDKDNNTNTNTNIGKIRRV